MYPIKFTPFFKSNIWGGNKIAKFKNIESELQNIGESWEISEVKESVSVVENGEFAGKTLSELIKQFPTQLIGNKKLTQFPLLIKLIDARDNLSIQVHPNDEIAKIRHNSLGKTEMWYVIDAEKDAFLYSGFSKTISKHEYEKRVANNTLIEVLMKHPVKSGDVFFLPAGRVHAIGKGIFLAEIQQNSDITYRIYDYNRKDANGLMRELHTDLAKDIIELEAKDDLTVNFSALYNTPTNLVSCNYFTVNYLKLSKEINCNNLIFKSFVVYMCVSGKALLKYPNGSTITIAEGETVLIPAQIANTTIIPLFECELLECYLPNNINS